MHLSTSAQISPISTRITQTQMTVNTHIPTHCLLLTMKYLVWHFSHHCSGLKQLPCFYVFFFHNRICQHLCNFWSSLFCCFPISFLLNLFLSVLKHLATTLPPGTELQLPVCCGNSFKKIFLSPVWIEVIIIKSAHFHIQEEMAFRRYDCVIFQLSSF